VLAVILVPIAIVSYFALSNFKVFNPRYVAVGAPAFFVLLAAGFTGLAPMARRLAGAAVLVLCALSLLHHYHGARYAKDDFRRDPRPTGRAAGRDHRGGQLRLSVLLARPEPVPVVYCGLRPTSGWNCSRPAQPASPPLVVSRAPNSTWRAAERWVQATGAAPSGSSRRPGLPIAAPVR
jgi:hypothetical protein